VDYHFLSHEQFQQRIREDAFLEYAEVHGNLYGTLRSEVEDRVLADGDVLLDIDVQGGSVLRRRLTGTPLEAVTAYVFLGPPSYEVLIERLHLRGTDHPEVIRLRLENARHELQSWRSYDYVIAIHDVEYTVERLRAVLLSQRCRVNRFVQAPWERGEETADGSRI
jgi:guanylate kinase